TFDVVRAEWNTNGPEIRKLLEQNGALSRAKDKFSPARVQKILENVAEACADLDRSNPSCIKALLEVTTEAINAGTKGTGISPVHTFFEQCSMFISLVEKLF